MRSISDYGVGDKKPYAQEEETKNFQDDFKEFHQNSLTAGWAYTKCGILDRKT